MKIGPITEGNAAWQALADDDAPLLVSGAESMRRWRVKRHELDMCRLCFEPCVLNRAFCATHDDAERTRIREAMRKRRRKRLGIKCA